MNKILISKYAKIYSICKKHISSILPRTQFIGAKPLLPVNKYLASWTSIKPLFLYIVVDLIFNL